MGALAACGATMLHIALLLVAAPLLTGLIACAKARIEGRAGRRVVQPWLDLVRLARKRPLLSEHVSWLTQAAPTVVFAASLTAAVIVPGFALGGIAADASDLLVLAGLLGLSRMVPALAALDGGTAFGAIGAGRSMAVGTFAEPALLLVVLTLGLLAQTTNLDAIALLLHDGTAGLRVSLMLALLALLAVALAATGRLPVDDPDAQQEPAMLHEAMALDYSGRHLAMLRWAASLRLLLWIDLIGAVFLPFSLVPAAAPLLWPVGMLAWLVRGVGLALCLAVAESLLARLRVARVMELLGAAILLGLLSVLLLFATQGLA